MAAGFFRSKESQPPGIPLATGRAVDRPAKSNPPRQEERVLTFVQKGENFFLLQGWKNTADDLSTGARNCPGNRGITAPDFYESLPVCGKHNVLPGQKPEKTTRFPHFLSVKMTEVLWHQIRFSVGFPV